MLERAKNNVGLILPGIAPLSDILMGKWLYQGKGKFKKLKEFMDEFHKTFDVFAKASIIFLISSTLSGLEMHSSYQRFGVAEALGCVKNKRFWQRGTS